MRWLATETFFTARRILAAAATFSTTRLTPHENQILRLVSSGLKHTEVAGLLEVSPRTVENHLRQIRHRLGVTPPPTGCAGSDDQWRTGECGTVMLFNQ